MTRYPAAAAQLGEIGLAGAPLIGTGVRSTDAAATGHAIKLSYSG